MEKEERDKLSKQYDRLFLGIENRKLYLKFQVSTFCG